MRMIESLLSAFALCVARAALSALLTRPWMLALRRSVLGHHPGGAASSCGGLRGLERARRARATSRKGAACVPVRGTRGVRSRAGRALVRGPPAWDERVFESCTVIMLYMTHQTQNARVGAAAASRRGARASPVRGTRGAVARSSQTLRPGMSVSLSLAL